MARTFFSTTDQGRGMILKMNKENAPGATRDASHGSVEQMGSEVRGWEVPKTINFTLVSTLDKDDNDETIYNPSQTNYTHKNDFGFQTITNGLRSGAIRIEHIPEFQSILKGS